MRVLFLTYHFPEPDQPGAFRPWVEARLLRELGHDVTVVTSAVQYMTGEDQRQGRSWCEEAWRDGIRVLRVWAPRGYRRHVGSRIANYLAYAAGAFFAGLVRGGHADVVFAGTDPVSVGPAAFLLSLIKRARLVLDERDLYPETAIALGVLREGWFSRLVFRLQEFWRRRATGILAATPGIARALQSYGHAAGKLGVMMNADPYISQCVRSVTEHADDLHRLLGRRCVVAYSGGLGQNNDVSTLLKAARRLRGNNNIGIAVIGEGEMRGAYEAFCRDQALDNVRILGPRARDDARMLLATADICVCLYHKGNLFKGTLASKVFDYLAVGKPVVFAGSGDTADLLKRAGGGLSVCPEDADAVADAIQRLDGDPELREALGAAGRAWYRENMSVEAALATLAHVIGGDNEDEQQEVLG